MEREAGETRREKAGAFRGQRQGRLIVLLVRGHFIKVFLYVILLTII